jgi:hypothetical protein
MEFFGQNKLNSKMSFQERALFKEYGMAEYQNLNLSDFLYKNPYYGKIDRKGYSITPRPEFLKELSVGNNIYVLDFVADAFEAFRNSFTLEARDRNISSSTSKYLNLIPSQGFQNYEDLFYNHTKAVFESMFQVLTDSPLLRKKACNYKNFLKFYFWFLEYIVPEAPITRPAFAMSRFCPTQSTGLIINLDAKANPSDDFEKREVYIKDPLFNAFVRKAAQYGFSVDKNNPARLVARINEPQMKFFLSLNNSNQKNLFEKYYLKTHIGDYNDFKENSLVFYNSFIEGFPVEHVPHQTKNGYVTKERKRLYADQNDLEDMGEEYWFTKYFFFRYLEKHGRTSGKFYKNSLRKHLKILKIKGVEKTIEKMERMFAKHPPEANPNVRQQMFDYGILDIESAIYYGKTPKTKEDILRTILNPRKIITAANVTQTAAVFAQGTGTTPGVSGY